MLQRYSYSEQFHIAPYPGSYTEQPAVWVDAVGIIARERPLAEAARRKRGDA